MAKPVGALERSLVDATIGLHRAKDKRERVLAPAAGQEIEQQIRVPLAGTAASGWGFVDKKVGFVVPFVYAPGQRLVGFDVPTFSYGIEFLSGTENLVIIHAHVIGWNIDEHNRCIGATVRFAVSAPQSEAATTFSAEAHLTFQGWATETEYGGGEA